MKKYIAYAIASGLLLTGWPSYGFPLLLFIGFVPLMLAEHQIAQRAEFKKKGRKIFGLSYLAFLFGMPLLFGGCIMHKKRMQMAICIIRGVLI